MEGLGIGLAGFSIVIQLVDSVKKLSDFWKSVEAAPSDVKIFLNDLDFLSIVLHEIAKEAQHSEQNATLDSLLQKGGENVQALNLVLHQLEAGFSSRKRRIRNWTAIKSVLKWEKLKDFSANLERLKTTLILALQTIQSHNARIQFQQQKQIFADIERRLSRLNVIEGSDITPHAITYEQGVAVRTDLGKSDLSFVQKNTLYSDSDIEHGPSGQAMLTRGEMSQEVAPRWQKYLLYKDSWVKNAIYGSIGFCSNRKHLHLAPLDKNTEWLEEKAQSESHTSITVRPAGWLSVLGFERGLTLDLTSSSITGWKHTLSSFRAVPDDALIFKLCEEGQISAVRLLLSTGKASVKDTMSTGIQPLHLAAWGLHTDLCKYLILAGADKSAKADISALPFRYSILANGTPLSFATWFDRPYLVTKDDSGSMMDTMRLFLATFDFSDPSNNGWRNIAGLVDMLGMINCEQMDVSRILRWVILQFHEDIKDNFRKDQYDKILSWLGTTYSPGILSLWLRLGPKGAIDTQFEDQFPILLDRVATAYESDSTLEILDALACGANPNTTCICFQASPLMESPTSLSMYSDHAFRIWLYALDAAEMDANKVFEGELRQGVLCEAGWTQETFQGLSNWEYYHEARPISYKCEICDQYFPSLALQPIWIYALEEIKNGKHPNSTILATNNPESNAEGHSDVSQELEKSEQSDLRSRDQAQSLDTMPDDHSKWDLDIFLALHMSFCEKMNCFLLFPDGTSRLEGDVEDESSSEIVHFDLNKWHSLRNQDMVCMSCWLELLGIDPKKTGYMPRSLFKDEDTDTATDTDTDLDTNADTDASSEHRS